MSKNLRFLSFLNKGDFFFLVLVAPPVSCTRIKKKRKSSRSRRKLSRRRKPSRRKRKRSRSRKNRKRKSLKLPNCGKSRKRIPSRVFGKRSKKAAKIAATAAVITAAALLAREGATTAARNQSNLSSMQQFADNKSFRKFQSTL